MFLKLVTFTSDFGVDNEGPGIMAATVMGICPEAVIVHLSHGVTPYNLIDGARQMECVATIPKGIHVCVVDPGVGSSRLGLVLSVPGIGYLVGPDNGVLLPAANLAGGLASVRCIENPHLLRHPVSSTFHGRDLFASVAGHLAAGVPFNEVGALLDPSKLVAPPYEDARFVGDRIRAMVIHINRFGSCILNIREFTLDKIEPKTNTFALLINGVEITKILSVRTFCLVGKGDPLLYPDSYGRLGLAINQGHAAETFRLQLGSVIEIVRWEPKRE